MEVSFGYPSHCRTVGCVCSMSENVTQDEGCGPHAVGGPLLHTAESKEEHDDSLAKDIRKDLLKELDNLSKKEKTAVELDNVEMHTAHSKEDHGTTSGNQRPKEPLEGSVPSPAKEGEPPKSTKSTSTTTCSDAQPRSSQADAGHGNKEPDYSPAKGKKTPTSSNKAQQASADADSVREKIRKKLSKKSSNAGSREKQARSK
ncbi:hypothetical protein Y032_0084g1755 [Ancylostoma ceylanicum]|uniref:Uncharacterized protein n=1 Tax=Ancylostoma ceylanicum TaxID=53326 RepID=A0A016TQS4_9BILA|nr:hypothetical protein Y032_0084g1755 [Ancylostoma ceylanicum]